MLFLLAACSTPPPPGPSGLEPALEAMLDRSDMARFDGARAWHHSSTDPRATRPGAPDWFANGDRGHVLRREGELYVLADEQGPGVFARLWSANPERGGTLRVVVDGEVELEGPMDALLRGEGKVPAPFAMEQARGSTLRLPITYAESLVVTMDDNRGKGVYWATEGVKLAEGTAVRPFQTEDLQDSALLERIGSALVPEPMGGPELTSLEAGGVVAWESASPGAVGRVAVSASRPPTGLRLVGTFDGVVSVDVPVGGLFGVGPSTSGYADAWRRVDVEESGWTGSLHAVMPFARSGSLRLENRSEEPVDVALSVDPVPFEVGPATLRFRASHRSEVRSTRPRWDFLLADWEGPGRLIADTLVVHNPVESWWGGGDEKIWTDGELHRGTGTEDYYGFAWCSNTVSYGPFGGQVHNERGTHTEAACDHSGGTVVASRARLLDSMPFHDRLRFTLGVRHRDDVRVSYEATVLGYAGRLLSQ